MNHHFAGFFYAIYLESDKNKRNSLPASETPALPASGEMMEQEQIVEEVAVDQDAVVLEPVDGEELDTNIEEPAEGEETTKELWETSEEGVDGGPVDLDKVLTMKTRLKGTISDRNDEIERLQRENDDLKQAKQQNLQASLELPVRPKAEDFDTDELYHAAVSTYEDKAADVRFQRRELGRKQEEAGANYRKQVTESVDSHYDRAAKLIESSGISSDVFKATDTTVRKSIEAIRPKQGDDIVDTMISLMGEGSEKVMYFVGRNKAALAELQSKLAEDPSGMKAAIYLGKQQERLNNPKKITSKAPKPPNNVQGDTVVNNGKALKRKYDAAHKNGGGQAAYNLKKQARKAGVDVSGW